MTHINLDRNCFCYPFFMNRLYKNHITDAGAKLVAQIIEECPRLITVK